MIKLRGPIAYFDVDDTLAYWDKIPINSRVIEFEFKGRLLKRAVIQKHVTELILQKEAGTSIIVWSKSGASWAAAIVTALGLEDYVDVATSKPDRIYDDKDPSEWMPKRRYYSEDL